MSGTEVQENVIGDIEVVLSDIIIPPKETERNVEDLNDQTFDHLLKGLGAVLDMFRSDAGSEAVEKAQAVKDIAPLRDFMVKRNMEGYQRVWDLIRFVQNLRQVEK